MAATAVVEMAAEAGETDSVASPEFRGTIIGKYESKPEWFVRFEKERCFMANTNFAQSVGIGVAGILLSSEQ